MESRFISKTIRKIIEAFCYIVWGFGLLRTDFVPGVIPGGGNKERMEDSECPAWASCHHNSVTEVGANCYRSQSRN